MRMFLMAIAFSSLAASSALSAAPLAKPPVAKAAETDTVTRIERYLSEVSTITSDFSQVAPDGSVSGGKFYLKRPGKMRWEYAAPTPILLVSDGKMLVYYDSELQQVTYIDMDDTLAGFLAQKTIKLESRTTHLTNIEEEAGMIRATMIQKSKPKEGSLTLEFSDKPLQLRQMKIVDATGQVTHVQLQNAKFGEAIDDKRFVFDDPRGRTRRTHR